VIPRAGAAAFGGWFGNFLWYRVSLGFDGDIGADGLRVTDPDGAHRLGRPEHFAVIGVLGHDDVAAYHVAGDLSVRGAARAARRIPAQPPGDEHAGPDRDDRNVKDRATHRARASPRSSRRLGCVRDAA
jgi:hypothetical protein